MPPFIFAAETGENSSAFPSFEPCRNSAAASAGSGVERALPLEQFLPKGRVQLSVFFAGFSAAWNQLCWEKRSSGGAVSSVTACAGQHELQAAAPLPEERGTCLRNRGAGCS